MTTPHVQLSLSEAAFRLTSAPQPRETSGLRPNPIGKVCRQFQRRWIPTASDLPVCTSAPTRRIRRGVLATRSTARQFWVHSFVMLSPSKTSRSAAGHFADIQYESARPAPPVRRSTCAKGQRCYTHGHRADPCGQLCRLDTRSYHLPMFRELVDVGSYVF
jgi:hypothetical protein